MWGMLSRSSGDSLAAGEISTGRSTAGGTTYYTRRRWCVCVLTPSSFHKGVSLREVLPRPFVLPHPVGDHRTTPQLPSLEMGSSGKSKVCHLRSPLILIQRYHSPRILYVPPLCTPPPAISFFPSSLASARRKLPAQPPPASCPRLLPSRRLRCPPPRPPCEHSSYRAVHRISMLIHLHPCATLRSNSITIS